MGFLFPDPLVRRVVGQVLGSRKLKGFLSGARREKQNKGSLSLSHSKGIISPISASACSRRDARPVTASIVVLKNTSVLLLTKKWETRFLLFQIRGHNPFLPPITLAIRAPPKPMVKNHPNQAQRIVATDHTRRFQQLHPLMPSRQLITKNRTSARCEIIGRLWPLLLQKHHRVFVNLSSDTFAKDSQLRDILQCSKLQQALRKFNGIRSFGKSLFLQPSVMVSSFRIAAFA